MTPGDIVLYSWNGYAQTSSERLPPALVGNIVKRQEPTARLYAE